MSHVFPRAAAKKEAKTPFSWPQKKCAGCRMTRSAGQFAAGSDTCKTCIRRGK